MQDNRPAWLAGIQIALWAIESVKKMAETKEEKLTREKRENDEYLVNKNEVFKNIPGLLHEFAKKYKVGGGELARAVVHGHIEVILDILQNGGKVNNITPDRFRGRIQKCLFYRHQQRNTNSFYMECLPHEGEEADAFHYDMFWIDIDQYLNHSCKGNAKGDFNKIGFIPNVGIYAAPPLFFGPNTYMMLGQFQKKDWTLLSEGLEIVRSISARAQTDVIESANMNLLEKGNADIIAQAKRYFRMCVDYKGKDHFYELTNMKTPCSMWEYFAREYLISYVMPQRYTGIKFYFLFGSIWMTCDSVKSSAIREK